MGKRQFFMATGPRGRKAVIATTASPKGISSAKKKAKMLGIKVEKISQKKALSKAKPAFKKKGRTITIRKGSKIKTLAQMIPK